MNVFSFSRISQYVMCPRSFYLKYVEGLVEPPSEPAELGKAVHRYIELVLKGEQDPMPIVKSEAVMDLKWDDVKKLAMHYLKKHQNTPLQKYEGHMQYQIGLGMNFQGYIDLLDESGIIPMITDFKSGRVFYEPNDTFQLRMYAWLIHKIKGYDVVNARLWFLRAPYKDAVRQVTYTKEDFEQAEQWAKTIIYEINSNLESVELGFEKPIEAFPPKHGHACTSCPFARECRSDLLQMPSLVDGESAKELAGKVLVLERILELAKEELKAYANAYGEIPVGNEVFRFRPSTSTSYPVDGTIEDLQAMGESIEKYIKMDTKPLEAFLKELLSQPIEDTAENADLLEKQGKAKAILARAKNRTTFSFVHQKLEQAGDEHGEEANLRSSCRTPA